MLDEPSEQEAEAAAVAVARALDPAVHMLRPGTCLAGWCSPTVRRNVRGDADHPVILAGATATGEGQATLR